MIYYFREIQGREEMLSWLKLRYTIYNSTRCAGFLSENELEIDVDSYDLQSKHYGLFVEEADQQHDQTGPQHHAEAARHRGGLCQGC